MFDMPYINLFDCFFTQLLHQHDKNSYNKCIEDINWTYDIDRLKEEIYNKVKNRRWFEYLDDQALTQFVYSSDFNSVSSDYCYIKFSQDNKIFNRFLCKLLFNQEINIEEACIKMPEATDTDMYAFNLVWKYHCL